ncbi:hypothetical protein O6H91_16G031000 [Diphasiastrum complanatum]|uniref:Uncharacterized protein n=1 Tax=Diphasiastrum complanatum TaxID=34168 RepID=A0ACC2BB47_DIPCM|nr:hypothetical protein O6H91_16G031000 [Diphasiastrum complanatum]
MEAPVAYVPYVGVHGVGAAAAFHEAKRPWKWAEMETAEAFRVDDLLDFSNEEIAGPIGEEDKFQQSDHSADSSVTVVEQVSNNSTSDKGRVENPNILQEEELRVACDDIAELEWLSTFVEDSFSTDEAMKPPFTSALLGANTHNLTELSSNNKDQFQMTSPYSVLESSATSGGLEIPVPGRARSKRSRAGVRVWSSRLLSSNSCTSLESISNNSITAPYFFSFDCPALSADTEFLTPEEWGDDFLPIAKKPTKIFRRKTGQDASQPRRCTHCLTQRTPQWRAGPMGPKTLCNACGVRFKSGRLLPEYRPAGSPTFVSHQHSNSHRKVLEMRRQRTTETEQQPQPKPPLQIDVALCIRAQDPPPETSEEQTVL